MRSSNETSPTRHLVQPDASAYGKKLAFGIYGWLVMKRHVTSQASDLRMAG
jgi:hypothetical protein